MALLLKVGSSGPAVTRLKEDLGRLNYSVDGEEGDVFGTSLAIAVRAFQVDNGLKVDGIVGPKTWAKLEDLGIEVEQLTIPEWMDDIRGKSLRRGVVEGRGARPKGVVIHQTGVRLASNPERWKGLRGHLGLMSNGRVVLVNDPGDFIWHAQGLSENVSLEVSGNFFGVEGKEETLWKEGGGPDHLTPEMIARVGPLFHWIKKLFDLRGWKWQNVYAHRQSYDGRRGDPGQEIWQTIAMTWIAQLKASLIGNVDGVSKNWKIGEGLPIPEAWDKAGHEGIPY